MEFGPVSQYLATLTLYHPRFTRDRLDAVCALEQSDLDPQTRYRAVSLMAQILEGCAREAGEDATYRGFKWTAAIGSSIGLMIAMGWFTNASPANAARDVIFIVPLVAMVIAVFLSVFIGPLVVPCVFIHSRRANDSVRAACATALGMFGDRTGLLALAEACRDRNPGVRTGAMSALPALVAPLLDTGADPLTGTESIALARALPRLDTYQAGRVLRALELCGAPSALAHLAAYSRSVRDAALAHQLDLTIARLEERRKEERQRETLLRAAERDQALALLHPVVAGQSADAAMLLRYPADDG